MASFYTNIKKYRLQKDITQQELADRVGVRRETVMRLENAKYNPSLELAIKISRILEVNIEELFVFNFEDI